MNVFQKEDARKMLLTQRAPVVWVEFRTAIEGLTNSYNQTSDGVRHPVILKPDVHDYSLILERQEGLMTDSFNSLKLVIAISFERSKYVITALKERWMTQNGSYIKAVQRVAHELELEVTLEESPRIFLRHDGQLQEPAAAAEAFLYQAFEAPPNNLSPHYD